MTYYGRWTYKYEEAARQGAAAAIIVHETIPGRLWLAGGAQLQLAATNRGSTPPRTRTRACCGSRAGSRWRRRRTCSSAPVSTMRGEGRRQQAWLQAAVPMAGETLSVERPFDGDASEDPQCGRRHPGHKHPDDVVLFSGALGSSRHASRTSPAPDKIYNGAVDNGLGVSHDPRARRGFQPRPTSAAHHRVRCSGRWKSKACWARNISPSIRSGRATISWAC